MAKTKFTVELNKHEHIKVDSSKIAINRITGKHGWVWLLTENELRDLQEAVNDYLSISDDRIMR